MQWTFGLSMLALIALILELFPVLIEDYFTGIIPLSRPLSKIIDLSILIFLTGIPFMISLQKDRHK